MELYDLYFDDELIQKNFEEITIINEKLEKQKLKIKLNNMSNNNWKIILEDTPNDFLYKKINQI